MFTIPRIKEYFIEFINVNSITRYDLTNILLDNGAKIKCQYKGVQ